MRRHPEYYRGRADQSRAIARRVPNEDDRTALRQSARDFDLLAQFTDWLDSKKKPKLDS